MVAGLPAALSFAGATILLSLIEAVLQYTGHPIPVYFPGAPIARWAVEVAIVFLTVGPVIGFLDALRSQLADLRDSEERFRSMSDASLEGIMIRDGEVILDTNLALARIYGYEHPDELIGKNAVQLLLTSESRARVLERVERGETGVIELTGVRKDGSTFPAEAESRMIKYHGRDARFISLRDVTERKRAMEAQLESEERYRGSSTVRSIACF